MSMYNYNQPQFTNPYARNYNVPNYAPQQYQMAQPQMVQQAQPQQPVQQEMPIQYVGYATIKEAEGYILFPNSKAIFIDKANDMVYEKICGQDGRSCINHYKKFEENSQNQVVESSKEQPLIDLSSYAKKDDLGEFVSLKQYNELLGKVEQLQKQIMGVKTNVAKQV